MSDEEVQKMREEAEQFAGDDEKRKESVEIRNQAETAIYQTEKTLKENEEKIEEELKTKIQASISDLKNVLEGDDTESIKNSLEKFMTDIQGLGEAVYSQQEPQEEQTETVNQEESEGSEEPEAVDGEFREV